MKLMQNRKGINMKKLYYNLKLRLKYLIGGIKTRKQIHLMDIVTYNNKEWFVNNAIRYCGQCQTKLYDLIENIPYDENNKREIALVSESKVKKVKNWDNFKRGIFHNYDFNMLYWHDINLRNLLGQ
jgi:hypothetical protein